MRRAILTAAVARDLATERLANATQDYAFPGVDLYKLNGATNGVLQAWSTMHGDDAKLLADTGITIYTTFSSMPNALKKFLILVRRSDSAVDWVNESYKRISDLTATDYVRFWSTLTGTVALPGALTTKLATTKLSTDRFFRQDCVFTQTWLGQDDASLGDTN